MLEAYGKGSIDFPEEIISQDDLAYLAERVFIPLLQKGIDLRTDIDGNSFPALEASTIKAKGHDRPLIETGKLRISFISNAKGKNSVVITLKGNRYDIGKYLQIDGVRSRHGTKYFRFFGITEGMQHNAEEYLLAKIDKVADKFNG